jgi:RNA polymerase sigma factor (sigma-70 family)
MADSLVTNPSLLLRIRDAQDTLAWSQFANLYAPLIHEFARRYGLQDADAADVTQEVLRAVARAVKELDYDPRLGSFRGWLYTVVRNQVRKTLGRKQAHQCGTGGTEAQMLLEKQLSPEKDETAEWHADYERRVFAHAATQVRGDFQETTWQAFWLTGVDGKGAKEVAEELGLTVAAVYLAKGRVMARLKEQIRLLQGE